MVRVANNYKLIIIKTIIKERGYEEDISSL